MRTHPTRWFVLVGALLAINLLWAILYGGRWVWLAVAVCALGLALTLWEGRKHDPPPP